MTNARLAFSRDALNINAAETAERIAASIREMVTKRLRKKGAVVALSGGIDSSVTAALSAGALGRERVFGLLLPEADSSPDSLRLGRELAEWLGIEYAVEDITPILEGARCYERRDAAIRSLIPEYGPGWKSKIVLPESAAGSVYPIFSVVVQSPQGVVRRARLTVETYLAIVAAVNFKQRTRKMLEYYYADRLNYAVAGTPNRLEYDQGFFVKNGDGAADFKPIAHLYKTQVYALARHLGIPAEIQTRPSTTDTYSMPQSQEEFYFALPNELMDLCLYGKNNGVEPALVAPAAGLTVEAVERVYAMIDSKRRATRYLHTPALLVEPVEEPGR
jgi:NAD+ synthase